MITVNQDLITKYIKGGNRHVAYYRAVDIADHLQFHIDGYDPPFLTPFKNDATQHFRDLATGERNNPYFHRLIDERRPGESKKIHDFRRTIYASVTEEPCFKVINSTKKIVRSEDWKVDYSKVKPLSKVPDDETLEVYAEQEYPEFKSVTNWLFLFAIKQILSDPNALLVTLPIKFELEGNEFPQPATSIIPSVNLYFYEPDHMAIYKSNKIEEFKNKDGKFTKVPVYQILTRQGVWESHQIDEDKNFSLDKKIIFDPEMFPAWLAGGEVKKLINNTPLYKSFLDPMLPRLDECAREYSDMQAEILQHIHSTLAVIEGQDCIKCSGTGKLPKPGGAVVCGDCKGKGTPTLNTYEIIIMKLKDIDKQPMPFPPAAYVEKSTEIAKLQDERVDKHNFKALSALNMEFLAKTPLNESGKAKEVDKEEVNNFMYGMAFHFVNSTMKNTYKYIILQRYGQKVQGRLDKELEEVMPTIQVPEHFDMLSENQLIDQLAKAKEAEVDPTIINEMQTDLINKKFRDMPETRDKLRISNEVNPFNTSSSEEIIDMEMAGLATKVDAIIALHADYFVFLAINEHKDFFTKTPEQQKEIIKKMADAKLTELKDVIPKEPIPPEPTE